MKLKTGYRFFFHYNKPASRAAKKPQISVHYRGVCHIVDNIACFEPCAGRVNKRQPYFVMGGSCWPEDFKIKRNICYINPPITMSL